MVVDCYGFISVENCTFTGYKGAVSTGVTAANDNYAGNPYLTYKGIPDGTTSAGILLKEMAAASLKGNTVTDCDKGDSGLEW